MADKIPAAARSENMRKIRALDTKPELIVRKLVHGLGYRYRLHRKDLPGRPDIVFGPRKKLIFVHGCFWHQHQDHGCSDGRLPKSRLDYWEPKLNRNIERDAENQDRLCKLGWDVLVVWECETRRLDVLAEKIDAFLQK